eukprot:TRINITY_DN92958_c0_g1_i1.p1 TRINITY_DN92958_c0_g1~~TRINITY_DN92958_c0_g1_i1.p1  ORF type:complete len:439 (+),score=102.75 TRINITY_DN92958_c0_g1_i1:28-1317(+)
MSSISEETAAGPRSRLSQDFGACAESPFVVVVLEHVFQNLAFIEIPVLNVVCASWRRVLASSRELLTELRVGSEKAEPPRELVPAVQLAARRLLTLECPYATDAVLEACAKCCPGLRHLLLAPCPDLSELPTVWRLQTLDIRGGLKCLPLPPGLCQTLTVLKMGWFKERDADGRGCDVMEFVNSWFKRTARDSMEKLAVEARGLKVLHIIGHLHWATFHMLGDLELLEELHLPYASAGLSQVDPQKGSLLCRVAKFPGLRSLNLRACSDDAPGLKNIEEINMSCTLFTPESLLHMAACSPKLRVLDLCYAQHLKRRVLPQLAQYRHPLEMLGLGGFDLVDADMALIVEAWPLVRDLGIGSADVTQRGFAELLALTKLRRLSAHKLKHLEEQLVWRVLDLVEEIDLDDGEWVQDPSEKLTSVLAERQYQY